MDGEAESIPCNHFRKFKILNLLWMPRGFLSALISLGPFSPHSLFTTIGTEPSATMDLVLSSVGLLVARLHTSTWEHRSFLAFLFLSITRHP